ncbi:Ig-like domain-containing protein [Flavobacterium magnum]|nr:Ig-like domain-containing protein [Flavobacterium magnum]
MKQVYSSIILFLLICCNTVTAQAVDDYFTTEQNIAINAHVLANDVTNGGLSAQSIYVVYQPAHGTTMVMNNGTPNTTADDYVTYTPNPNYNGVDSFVYQITDAAMVTTMATAYIVVTPDTDPNDPPTAVDDIAYTAEDVSITITVLQNDFFGSAGPATGPIGIAVNPANGTVTVNNNGTPNNPVDDSITYTPNANYFGQDTFAYVITGVYGNADTATVTVYISEDGPPYDPPFAGDDTATTSQDSPVVIEVLMNDTYGTAGPQEMTIASQPSHGTATVNDNGTPGDPYDDRITYVPQPNYAGADSFMYTITDVYGNSDTATVTVVIVIDSPGEGPLAANDMAFTDENYPVTIDVLNNDTFGAYGPGSISLASQPTYGTATINNNGTPGDATDDTINYIPNPNYNGVDVFTYHITDVMMVTSTGTVIVTVVPPTTGGNPPTAADDVADTAEDVPVTVSVLQNDTFGSYGPATGSIGIAVMPVNGTVIVNNTGTPNDPSDDTITYSPNPNYFGQDTFSYVITNAFGDTDMATVTITVRPDSSGEMPPYAAADNVATLTNTAVSISVLANDTFGDSLPANVVVATQPINGTAFVDQNATPDNPADDLIVYTPNNCFSGIDTFSYTIYNAEGLSASAAVTVVIVPATPVETYEEVTACDSFNWHGEVYTVSGDYTYESTNATGCATTARLHLTINNSTVSSETITACNSYTWHGNLYTVTGDYTFESLNASGCANTDTLHLTVNHTPAPTAPSTQSFCSGSVAALVATGTDIHWYLTPSGGTALSADTALMSGTYYASQTVDGCESARTAVNVTAQVAMPAAPSPQTFLCGAKRTNLSATGTAVRWYTTATGGTAMSSSELLVSGTYYATQTIGGCQSSRKAVEVIINNIPAPTASDQTLCYNGTVQQLMATGTDLKWYLSETGGTPLPMSTPITATTYYVSQKSGTCESPRTAVQVTLDGPALPDAPSSQTYNCGARRTSLVATGIGLKWYTTASGGAAISASTLLVAGSYFVSQTIGGCEGPRREISVTIITPSAPTASAQTFCTAATVANLTATGTGIKWYANNTDATPLASTTPLATGTYYVSQTNSMMCDSARTPVQVTIGGAPMPEAPSPQTLVCGSKRTALTATGTSLLWYNVPTGGTALSSTAVLTTGTYYVTQTITGGCVSNRKAVSVIITNPAAPTVSAQTLCSGATVASLNAMGMGLKWYTVSTGGTALATTTPLATGIYYVSQTVASCESDRAAVSVTINTTPMPDAPSPQVFACNVKRPSLIATGTALLWYTVPTGGTALSSTAQLATGTYYVSQTVDGCSSARRAVSVTVNATAPPTTTNQTHCSGASVSSLTATGTALKWYASASGGMPLASTTTLTSGTYFVSQTLNGCESLRSAANVTISSCVMKPADTGTAQTQDITSTVAYGIRIYPNPTSSVLNVKPEGNLVIDKITIIDSSGRIVLERDGDSTEVDVNSLARGIYLLRASSGDRIYQSKFVKE